MKEKKYIQWWAAGSAAYVAISMDKSTTLRSCDH